MEREDLLLQGALDLHAHGYPEFTVNRRPRVDNVGWAHLASAASMRGFVMKSHIWPTPAVTHMLAGWHSDLEIFGSITLNPPVGGLNPLAVELAAQMGAKVVWMPTWSARHDPPRPSIFLERMRPWVKTVDSLNLSGDDSITILDDAGDLLPEVVRILELCREYDMTLASGHLPIASSIKLSAAAKEHGVRFLLTHASSGSVGASIEQQRMIVANGGLIEHVMIGCMPMHQRHNPADIAQAITELGPEHCVMASDAGEAWNPPAPEVLRMFIGSMLALGISEEAVHLMTHDNPARALGLPVQWSKVKA